MADFRDSRTTGQKIRGWILGILFILVIFIIIYVLRYVFYLPTTTPEGRRISSGDWYITYSNENVSFSPDEPMYFHFGDDGNFKLCLAKNDEKLASGMYRIKINDKDEDDIKITIKLLTNPFSCDYPETWDFGFLPSTIDVEFIYSRFDGKGDPIKTIKEGSDSFTNSDVMKFYCGTEGFIVVRKGTEDFGKYKTEKNEFSELFGE